MGIGLAIAAPVGPIGLLVIQRTLQHGRALGLATGLGAALADALYGALGAYGMHAAVQVMQGLRGPLAAGGGAFLLWLAWRTWRTAAAPASTVNGADEPTGARPSLAGAFAGTVLLTLSNPATILAFIGIFGALAARPGAVAAPGWMVAGVLLGSALWWGLLCAVVGALRQRVGLRAQRAVARGSALLLAGFGLWTLAGLVAPRG